MFVNGKLMKTEEIKEILLRNSLKGSFCIFN